MESFMNVEAETHWLGNLSTLKEIYENTDYYYNDYVYPEK